MTDLSVVIPAYNAREHIAGTIGALAVALKRSGWPAELVVVDDGSTDGTADQACAAASGRMPIRVVRQPNTGRFAARRAGIEAAKGTHILLLDSRVQLAPDALAFVHRRLSETQVWNGHVHVVAEGNPFGAFWNVLVRLAWADYFAAPRTTTFDARTFDRFPKGTGCFLAPRTLLLEAVGAFRSRYEDLRLANDDTPLIRWIAEREPIGISPDFSCRYTPPATLGSFLRHAEHRGVVFLDGHGRSQSRFFPAVVAFYPVSAILAGVALRRSCAPTRAGDLGVGCRSGRPFATLPLRGGVVRGSRAGVRSSPQRRHVARAGPRRIRA